MIHLKRIRLKISIQILCFVLFSLCSYAGNSQDKLKIIKQEVIQNISTAKYEKAIKILENNRSIICDDTTGLFDALINLYFFEKKWKSILELYSLHNLNPNEDTSTLALARFYSKYEDEKIILNSKINFPYKPSQIGIPVVEVKVNGEKYYFWVDTGAGMTVLSSKVADACMINQNTTAPFRA